MGPGHHGRVSADLSPTVIVKLLADGDRLRVVASVVLGAGDLDEVVAASGLDRRPVSVAVSRLVAAGLVERDEHGLRVAEELIRVAARASAPPLEHPIEHPLVDDSVLRAFVAGDSLRAIPSTRHKLLQVLDLLAQDFDLGRRYTERQVNDILRRWHPDVATLRRHLVDFGFLDRQGGGGAYWRSGGSTLT
jgi:hypothetical protein